MVLDSLHLAVSCACEEYSSTFLVISSLICTMKSLLCATTALASTAAGTSIAEINGDRFLSPFKDKSVSQVKGLVTAVAENGVFLRSTQPDNNPATSEGLFVFSNTIGNQVKTGDVVTLNGVVKEFRSNPEHIYLTELSKPSNIVVVSSGNTFKPLIVGVDTPQPPNREYSSLDKGGVFGFPNAVTSISAANPRLDPKTSGLDFWESLVGELVTLQNVFQVSRPNKYGDVWVRGNYTVTGLNGHGGVTMLKGDANPETIVLGTPIDGSHNPTDTKMGDYLGDVTGVVYYSFGTYRILPLTALKPTGSVPSEYPATFITGTGDCHGFTVADYNAENLAPDSPHMNSVIDQIVHKLRLPDLVFLQEVQDNSGPTNDGVVSANVTLSTLTQGIKKLSGVTYNFTDVDPVDGQDGGQPGGNIRCAYLYRPDTVELYKVNPGSSNDANEVLDGPELKFNPGRIGQTDDNFEATRKPLIAMWTTVKQPKKEFFTVNVHFSSKGGSTGLHGDPRPPVNKGIEKRTGQMELTADLIAQILQKDAGARIIASGDFNEFAQVRPMQVFAAKSGLVEADEAAGLPEVERYTYLYDQNSEALDHMFISESLTRNVSVEHLHLNTWQEFKGQTSDHDPSVARLDMCGAS
ncbi:endonuclease/exonuclease/phosphatase family protein [Moelleriella libera RCEF 2490]|uniref:Endonuclease/exonuclease/phosphatase family protein n=1 Tax=Moelleriella libera RCEF 2490 TaxID=1081109 RepID=A0A168CJG2_9HYPO|nr:endonuclease/exonuclease/phosphatase family protein [Moelleriella libera RCEF 2490]